MKKVLTIRVTNELYERLKQLAKDDNRDVSGYVRLKLEKIAGAK